MSGHDQKRAFAVDVVTQLKQAGFQALWAGGCVRDFLMGRPPQDYDVATSALPDQVRTLFGRRKTLAVGAAFGVIVVRGPKEADNVEVATFRTEGPYGDGRRPDHVTFSSPEEDAKRRDFTINGMFYDPIEQRVLDFVGGEKDLGARIVRAIGDPHDRVREDKLRMLRAVRFAATMDFQLDETTARAIREMADDIHVVSAERITQELKRMLVDPHRMRAMQLTHEVGLLSRILPELGLPPDAGSTDKDTPTWSRTLSMLGLLQEPDFELTAAVLLHSLLIQSEPSADTVRAICRRLKFSNHETDHIVWLVEHQHEPAHAPKLSAAKLKRLMARPFIVDLLALDRAKTLAANADLSAVVFCEEFLQNTPDDVINPPPLLSGDDLIAQGFIPGRSFKEIIETVRDAQLNGEITSKDEALALAARLQSEAGKREDGGW